MNSNLKARPDADYWSLPPFRVSGQFALTRKSKRRAVNCLVYVSIHLYSLLISTPSHFTQPKFSKSNCFYTRYPKYSNHRCNYLSKRGNTSASQNMPHKSTSKATTTHQRKRPHPSPELSAKKSSLVSLPKLYNSSKEETTPITRTIRQKCILVSSPVLYNSSAFKDKALNSIFGTMAEDTLSFQAKCNSQLPSPNTIQHLSQNPHKTVSNIQYTLSKPPQPKNHNRPLQQHDTITCPTKTIKITQTENESKKRRKTPSNTKYAMKHRKVKTPSHQPSLFQNLHAPNKKNLITYRKEI